MDLGCGMILELFSQVWFPFCLEFGKLRAYKRFLFTFGLNGRKKSDLELSCAMYGVSGILTTFLDQGLGLTCWKHGNR